MLTLMHHNTDGLPHPFPTLEALLAEPFPRTPQDMMQLEQQLSTAAAQTVVYLSPADKSHRLTRRLSQGQKGLEERALLASQRPSEPW